MVLSEKEKELLNAVMATGFLQSLCMVMISSSQMTDLITLVKTSVQELGEEASLESLITDFETRLRSAIGMSS